MSPKVRRRYIAPTLFLLLFPSCSCSETDQQGHPDAITDAEEDGSVVDVLVPDGPCGPCDDSDPCTMDLCNTETLECVFLPLDMDFDGHVPTECDGDDCDDTRPDVYAGAREVCLDGVDQDCDTLVDGPVVMRHDIQVTTTEDSLNAQDLVWTGSQFAIAWTMWSTRDRPSVSLSRLDALGDEIGDTLPIREETFDPVEAISIAWSGESLATIWWERREVGDEGGPVFTRTSPTGEVEVPSFRTTSGRNPGFTWSGDGYGMAYRSPDGSASLAVLDADGTLVHGPTLLMEHASGSWEKPFDVSWTGSGFGALWVGLDIGVYRDIYLGTASPTAVPDGSPVRLTDTGVWFRARLAWTGSEFGIAASALSSAVFFLRADPSGTVIGDSTRLSAYSTSNDFGEIVWTGSEFGVAWVVDDEPSTIAFLLVDAEGEKRHPVMHVPTRGSGEKHAIAWTGSELGVSWIATRDPDDCLTEPIGPGCTSEVYFNRIGLCD